MKTNRKKTLPSLLAAASLLLSLLSGCGADRSAATPSPSIPPSPAAETASASPSAAAGPREITDMEGNQVTIPAEVKKVYCTSPIGTYITYTLAPDRLLGWNSALTDDAKQYIAKEYQDLEVLGGTMGGKNSINTEAIIALAPDVILDFSHGATTSAMVTQLSQQSGIPAVTLDSSLEATPASYRLLGEIFGAPDRGNQLADYAQKILDTVSADVAKVPENEKVKVYYAESADGLKTDGVNSMHTEVIDFVNAINVVTMDTSASGQGADVSMEQVLDWNPDVILANATLGGTDFLSSLSQSSTWASVNAVKNQQVYLCPASPFNWFDRPPSIARLMGVEWLAAKLYPQYVTFDLKSDVKDFYHTFYGVDITDAQAESLISGTGGT